METFGKFAGSQPVLQQQWNHLIPLFPLRIRAAVAPGLYNFFFLTYLLPAHPAQRVRWSVPTTLILSSLGLDIACRLFRSRSQV